MALMKIVSEIFFLKVGLQKAVQLSFQKIVYLFLLINSVDACSLCIHFMTNTTIYEIQKYTEYNNSQIPVH